MPCQVPSASFPSLMGTLTEAPTSADLTCACRGISRDPAHGRDGHGSTNRHIVRPLGRVPVQIPLPVLRYDSVQRVAHVGPYVFIPVLVQGEGARRVLHEQMEQPDLVVSQLGQVLLDVVRDEVRAAAPGREGEGLLEPGHGRRPDVGAARGRAGSDSLGAGSREGAEGQSEDEGGDVGEEANCEEQQ